MAAGDAGSGGGVKMKSGQRDLLLMVLDEIIRAVPSYNERLMGATKTKLALRFTSVEEVELVEIRKELAQQ